MFGRNGKVLAKEIEALAKEIGGSGDIEKMKLALEEFEWHRIPNETQERLLGEIGDKGKEKGKG